MTCDENCNCTNNEEEDDFEIQRLQDIITICEFLIKHKRNQKYRDKLDQVLDDLMLQDTNDDKEKDDNRTTRVIYHPIYYPPWRSGSGSWTWDRQKYPWYNIWS